MSAGKGRSLLPDAPPATAPPRRTFMQELEYLGSAAKECEDIADYYKRSRQPRAAVPWLERAKNLYTASANLGKALAACDDPEAMWAEISAELDAEEAAAGGDTPEDGQP